MSTRQDQFCRQLSERFPTASRVLVEHLDDSDNLLPHVFMAELTRRLLRGTVDRAQIVQHLEDSFASADSAIQELIAVSCVENIEDRDDLEQLLEGVNGNSLQSEWNKQHS